MVTADESPMCQQISALNSKDSNHMQLQLEQNCSFVPSGCTDNPAFPGQRNGVAEVFDVEHQSHNISYPSCNPCLKNFPEHEIGVLDKPVDASRAPRKRFLIFDRSGNRTRFFVGPSFSRQKSTVASEAPATTSDRCGTVACGVHQQSSVKPVVEEKWDENDLSDGEGEMLEDAEEINALLYSDSDDDDDDDDDANDGTDSENDEVTSTRHTPFSFEDWQNKGKSLEKALEQVVNGDGSPKRRKLLDGSCKKSSSHSAGGSSCNYEDVVAYSIKNERKLKIHKALQILGSIIPEPNSKDPLSIIERAIVHLETTKIEAEALGIR